MGNGYDDPSAERQCWGGGQNGILGLVHGMFLNMSEQDVLTCTREGK